jgi:hypothetical protein
MKYEIITGMTDNIVLVVDNEIEEISEDMSSILSTIDRIHAQSTTLSALPEIFTDKTDEAPVLNELGNLFEL